MGKALYRTYRSRSLGEVVGQEHITATLARAIAAGKISHAYLFTGPRGVGKTSVARILAHEINQIPYSDTTNLDIVEIDAASNRRIDDIRDLREKVHIAPVSGKFKVYIIDEVHMLTSESFNALLKTLEEPPSHVVFILATTEVHKLPATIISRTQRYTFKAAEPNALAKHLKEIADKEKINITDDALAIIAEHGDGSFRDSISLLDQIRNTSDAEITADTVTAALGLAPKTQLETLVAGLLHGDHSAITTSLAQLEASGSATTSIVQQLTKTLAQKAASEPRLYALIDALIEVPRAYHPSLKLLTTLMQFAGPGEKTKQVPTLVTAPPPVHIASATPPKKVSAKKAKEPAQAKKEEKPTLAPTSQLSQLSPADWQNVLVAVKKASVPLHSVVKQAQPNLQGDTLTLAFKYPLLSKKLDDMKHKTMLSNILQEILGGSAIITATVDKNATPPPATADPTVNSVAAIMGGGEVVDA